MTSFIKSVLAVVVLVTSLATKAEEVEAEKPLPPYSIGAFAYRFVEAYKAQYLGAVGFMLGEMRGHLMVLENEVKICPKDPEQFKADIGTSKVLVEFLKATVIATEDKSTPYTKAFTTMAVKLYPCEHV